MSFESRSTRRVLFSLCCLQGISLSVCRGTSRCVCFAWCSLPSSRARLLTSLLTYLIPTFRSRNNQTPPILLKHIPYQDIAPVFSWGPPGQEEKLGAAHGGGGHLLEGMCRCCWAGGGGGGRMWEQHSPQVSRWRAEAGLTWWVGLGDGQGGRKQAQWWRWVAGLTTRPGIGRVPERNQGLGSAVATRQATTLRRIRIPAGYRDRDAER